MKLILILLLIFPQFVFAGQGRDGGWPQSIQLLRIAKQNLLELLAQSSDQDVKDALNGMKDREENIKVEDVNLALLKRLVQKLENPDVEQIEKSQYSGVRLFYYESNSDDIQIYATKNFYAMERYQVQPNEINAAILKEVQTLILHEISHLWGFGEENGDINFARTFAVRMVNILHGSLKINFTQKEKLESLSVAFFQETSEIREKNAHKVFDGGHYQCVAMHAEGEIFYEMDLHLDPFKHSVDGYHFRGNENSILRWTLDFYLMAETTSLGASKGDVVSAFMKKQGARRSVREVTICHKEKAKVEKYLDRFVRPYFSRSNLLTDYANSSQVVFQSLLTEDVQFLGDAFKSTIEVSKANQKQIIQNIDFKIKVQNAHAYEQLTKRKSKYSKPEDSEAMELFNSLINSDLSNEGKSLWAQVDVKVRKLNSSILALNANPSRQLQMDSFFKDFLREFNAIADRTSEMEQKLNFSSNCGREKRIGDFYACQIEQNKINAQSRINMYEMLITDMNALVKRFTNRANAIRD